MPDEPRLTIALPGGRTDSVAPGSTVGDVLARAFPEKAGAFLAALLDGQPVDLAHRLTSPGAIAPLTFSDRAGRDILEHSSAHLVAKALVETIPDARPTHGPPTEEGFFYDFEVRPLVPADLDAMRAAMDRAIAAKEPFVRRELSREEAERIFARNPHKLRYIAETPMGEPISVYETGTFVDLCRGPHVPHTGWLAGIHILGFSGLEREPGTDGPALQRVRGIGFPTKAELEAYLKLRTEAEARDHRTIGSRQELFLFIEEIPGFPFWLPKGMVLVRELESYVREHLRSAGYAEVRTPLLFPQSVYETSGHWEMYREDMFVSEIEGRTFGWKPMNCPGSMLIFRSRSRSYRELPMRLAEFAPLHRYEASGTLHGLTRVRELVQDDAHVFVTEEQIDAELKTLLDWIREAFTTFRLEWSYELSTRPARFLGEVATWEKAEATLERALQASGVPYRVAAGEGGFYAPKIDIHVRDSLGRPWQTGTIQLDYQMPKRFGLEYQGPDGQLHTPVVIHRTILGTWERFLGVFIEHCAGRFPPWLAPVQARILPVTDRQADAARALADELTAVGLRAEVATPEESLSKRVRSAELDRVPYVLVLGDREIQEGQVSLRVRGSKESRTLSRSEFTAHALDRIRRRDYDP
ncbi:MAG TPA: threonine--tRNA ligase [Thermoplasmata archaeon]|nr:threonine--tRNA ligase [Thermoplasmata archaeon]